MGSCLTIEASQSTDQRSHDRAIKDFAKFLGRAPDTATPEELRAHQLYMPDTGVTASTFNLRIVALRFFFGKTCVREDMKRYTQFRTEPRKLRGVFSVEEVSDILMAAPGPAWSIAQRSACPTLPRPRTADEMRRPKLNSINWAIQQALGDGRTSSRRQPRYPVAGYLNPLSP